MKHLLPTYFILAVTLTVVTACGGLKPPKEQSTETKPGANQIPEKSEHAEPTKTEAEVAIEVEEAQEKIDKMNLYKKELVKLRSQQFSIYKSGYNAYRKIYYHKNPPDNTYESIKELATRQRKIRLELENRTAEIGLANIDFQLEDYYKTINLMAEAEAELAGLEIDYKVVKKLRSLRNLFHILIFPTIEPEKNQFYRLSCGSWSRRR